jgi:hypothetical protein
MYAHFNAPSTHIFLLHLIFPHFLATQYILTLALHLGRSALATWRQTQRGKFEINCTDAVTDGRRPPKNLQAKKSLKFC